MKVLSLTEPFATLIKEKKKWVETRGWKTNYRGPLYIHASRTPIASRDFHDQELMGLVENKEMNFGFIICKCNLVDCIFMTDEYVSDMKENHYLEYICGEYRPGRYAWLLEDIEPLNTPIRANGQLNIWNYYDAFDVMDLLKNFQVVGLNQHVDESFLMNYGLQSPKELIQHKIGMCWDFVELERYYLKGNCWNIATYFLDCSRNHSLIFHTFLTFETNHKFYWLEYSWKRFQGIHEYDCKKNLLLDVKKKFLLDQINHSSSDLSVDFYEYKQPKFPISGQEFLTYCRGCTRIDFDSL